MGSPFDTIYKQKRGWRAPDAPLLSLRSPSCTAPLGKAWVHLLRLFSPHLVHGCLPPSIFPAEHA